jgi:CheY-like chemotaxis protein
MTAVLVVDDDPGLRHILSEVLATEGYSVQTAEHGGPALELMRASPERLVVTLGLVMPEVDGLAVLEAVAADPALIHRHAIVVVSAAVYLATTGQGQVLREQLGASFVPKPFTLKQLLNAVAEAEQRLTMGWAIGRWSGNPAASPASIVATVCGAG